MARKKPKGRTKAGPVEKAVDDAITLYDVAKNPLETAAKEATRVVARKADDALLDWKRSQAAKKGWDTKRRRYGPKGHR